MDETAKQFLTELLAMISKAVADRQQATQSQEIDKLTEALIAVQAELEGVEKESPGQVGNQKYEYADLHACFVASRPLLTKNGLAVAQVTKVKNGENHIITKLLHKSGQWIEGEMLVKPAMKTPQGEGSALTYGRRYSYSAMIGLAQKDDDGAAGSQQPKGNKQPPAQQQSRPTPPPIPGAAKTAAEVQKQLPNHAPKKEDIINAPAGGKVISDKQQKRLFAILKGKPNWTQADVKYVLETTLNLQSSALLNKEQYDWLVNLIETTEPTELYKQ